MPSASSVGQRIQGSEPTGAQRETSASSEIRKETGVPFARDAQVATKSFERSARAADLFPVAVQRRDVASAAGAAGVLSKLLARPELEGTIAEISDRLDGEARARFEQSLGSFALLADAALTMLDYSKLGTGWEGWGKYGTNYPENREGYRQRAYRPDFDEKSQPRRERSKLQLGETITGALGGADPVAAIEAALTGSFISQIGISEDASAGWKPNVEAVSKALDEELFIPLRALADATLRLDHRGVPLEGHAPAQLDRMCRNVIEEITKHVVEGDFAEWRFDQDAGRLQLSSLTPEQLETYRKPLSLVTKSRSGRTLKTHDEQGSGLFWVTKIGGPSHGFDMLSQCLIPLLANARNGAIVVDEEGWPAAARSVMRLLPTTDGKPVLYLEMLQVDFPHDRPGRSTVTRPELRMAIIEHAVEKARAMGVPLVLAPSKFEPSELYAQQLGLRSERKDMEFLLHPSAGVFEASDSLLGAHHRPQTKEEIAVVPNEEEEMLPHPSMAPVKPLFIEP